MPCHTSDLQIVAQTHSPKKKRKMELVAAADHDEVCAAGLGASTLSGAQTKLEGRGVACLSALCALVIQFACTNWKKHIYFSNTVIMQAEAGIRGCEKSTKPLGGGVKIGH